MVFREKSNIGTQWHFQMTQISTWDGPLNYLCKIDYYVSGEESEWRAEYVKRLDSFVPILFKFAIGKCLINKFMNEWSIY